MKTRTRFAPSPTGYMHIGNLRTALYEYLIAKAAGGDFVLRIEDTDQRRFVEGATDIIYATLKRVGMNWDEGPDIGGNYGPYVQSERKAIYAEYAHKLVDLGGAHYCFCAASENDDADEENAIPVKFKDPCKLLSVEEARKRIAAGEKFVVRQTINKTGKSKFHDVVYGDIEIDYDDLDEGVLLKSDGFPTYNFANVVDDHLMEITHVVRGNEYISSTPKYNLIYESFGWTPPVYVHVPQVMKDAQHKLSKRNGDASFQDLVAKGYLPEAVLNYIALLGWNPGTDEEIFSLEDLKKVFKMERINKSPAIFDLTKLTWMNGCYIRALSPEAFHEMAMPFYKQAVSRNIDFRVLSEVLQPRTEVLGQIPEEIKFLENVAVPLLGIAVVMLIVYPFCVENGVCDYRKLWIVSGIPFGVQKMYFWMIPKGFDIGGTVGMFAFNLLVGGLIGSMVLTWRLLMAGKYLLKSIGYGGLWIVKKVFRT